MIVTEDYDWLSAHLDDPKVVVLDARGKMLYRFGHIENALPIGIESLVSVADNGANLVIDSRTAEEVFTQLRIDNSKAVVVYGENTDPSAARVVWSLLYHGHPNVKLLEIGFSEWMKVGLATSKQIQPILPQMMRTSLLG